MIIAVANQKGGVGKSTTAQALAARFTSLGKRVLLVDMDAQINTTATVGADVNIPSVFELLMGKATAAEAIQKAPGATIIAGSPELYTMDTALTKTGKEWKLKNALAPITKNYDFIVLDTPPALGILTINALTATDGVLIPACAEVYGLQGIAQLHDTILSVRTFTNKKIWTMGILLTRYKQTTLMKGMEQAAVKVAKKLNTTLYKSHIRETTTLKEAQAAGRNIYDHAPDSIGAQDYTEFTKEFLAQIKKGRGRA